MPAWLPYLSNSLWAALGTGHYRHFRRSLGQVAEVQAGYLRALLARNAGTRYGRKYGFAAISSPEDYQKAVPLTRYEDYQPYLEEIAGGAPGVLTAGPVRLFQPTSGTAAASKLIPYTATLQAEFQGAIAAWMAALFRRRPELRKGRAYWSISPPVERARYYGRVPVGFADDADYLGFLGQRLYDWAAAVPGRVAVAPDTAGFWRQTLVYLLAARDLALISVWSPTFLLLALEYLTGHRDEVIGALAGSGLRGAGRRAVELESLLREGGGASPFPAVWPNLGLVSCWTHGASQTPAGALAGHFPGVEIQGKGLVATEAFVSLPLEPGLDPVLAVDAHFFEFRDAERGDLRLAHEVEEGRVYSVVVTTGGGLYRYQLGDLVRVTGFCGQAPALRFVARETVADWCGEKLHADHVQEGVARAAAAAGLTPAFCLVAPVRLGTDKLAYTLFLAAPDVTAAAAGVLARTLEGELRRNFHYDYCRKLGQLQPLRVFLIDGVAASPVAVFTAESQRRGLRLGEIKAAILDRETGWEGRFTGRFLVAPR